MRWLLALFLVVPLAELYLLLLIGSWLGLWPTVVLTVVTGAVGGLLAKHEGLKVWRSWRQSLETFTMPEAGVLDGVLVLVGGALLVTPGVLTDATGLLLLAPWTRRAVARRIRAELDRRFMAQQVRLADRPPGWPTAPSSLHGGPSRPPAGVVDTAGETVKE